ncbi:MAG TPA: threonine ammonia-lyase, biosynthetic [Steroidobacteraceae bacterium]|nr:threonine ammonia-lyase, biosynthetic [Steroidobacteraceae bacterium]
MSDGYLERIRQAKVYEVAIESPLDLAPRLSQRLGHEVRLKREDLQPVFSFKLRGAYNKIAQLGASAARGVITASAGNHAQGVALAAQRRRVRAVIVMPQTTPAIKVQAVADLGGEVILHGDVFDTAFERATELAREQQLSFVHPFDDPDVIAGQGTVGMEIIRQTDAALDAIFVPVGGGGLIAGIGAYVKQLHPQVRIIGVEPEDAAAMYESLQAGRRVTLEKLGLFADGVAVRRVGEQTFALARRYVDEVVKVNTDEICAAIQDVFEDTRAILEPAGALAVAGIKRYAARAWPAGQRFVAINSGANLNFDRLRYIAERADLGAGREALLAVEIPEQPGSFLRFCGELGQHSVTEFNYRYQGAERAQLFVGFGLHPGQESCAAVIARLRAAGYGVVDMSGNEMAKLHVRYMIGGNGRGLADELIFRFEFPERPGALLGFLQAIGSTWNITLFHYRNHGSDNGRVLTGIQVPSAGRELFVRHLQALSYPYTEETANPAYRSFLAG